MPSTAVLVGRRPAAAVLAFASGVAALVVAVAGCGVGAASVALPVKPSPQRTAATVARRAGPPSVRAQVVAAYEGYWRATSLALDSRNRARARAILSRYVPPIAVTAFVRVYATYWRRDEISYGGPVSHVLSVKITGPGKAAVHDCMDMTRTGFQNAQTGQVIGGLGQPHCYMITMLARRGGRWLITGQIQVVAPCSY